MAGADEFIRRIDYLDDQVGHGKIVAGCTVDQIYAQNQHQNLRFQHTVGRSHYLGGPLLENATRLLNRIAESVIDEGGSHLRRAMIGTAEEMARFVLMNAPRDPDIGDVLANSGAPWVTSQGQSIYQRPPVQPREAEDHR
jgi:hypothetical protein